MLTTFKSTTHSPSVEDSVLMTRTTSAYVVCRHALFLNLYLNLSLWAFYLYVKEEFGSVPAMPVNSARNLRCSYEVEVAKRR